MRGDIFTKESRGLPIFCLVYPISGVFCFSAFAEKAEKTLDDVLLHAIMNASLKSYITVYSFWEPKTPQVAQHLRGCFVYIISTKLMTTASKSQMCSHIRTVYSSIVLEPPLLTKAAAHRCYHRTQQNTSNEQRVPFGAQHFTATLRRSCLAAIAFTQTGRFLLHAGAVCGK